MSQATPKTVIQAIPTVYAGVQFRSRLEAEWALNLDRWEIAWSYEPEGFELPSGVRYLPDFWLPEINTWLEIKGPGVAGLDKTSEFARLMSHEPECLLHFGTHPAPDGGYSPDCGRDDGNCDNIWCQKCDCPRRPRTWKKVINPQACPHRFPERCDCASVLETYDEVIDHDACPHYHSFACCGATNPWRRVLVGHPPTGGAIRASLASSAPVGHDSGRLAWILQCRNCHVRDIFTVDIEGLDGREKPIYIYTPVQRDCPSCEKPVSPITIPGLSQSWSRLAQWMPR